jgi:benzoyl-CoA reductase/2-hydroxyglutaryl-CoA dehydratase subunit BcrC/BadD/HgdB
VFFIYGKFDLTWQACHTYNVEAELVRQLVTEEYGLPYLQLETDYSTSDVEQLKTRAAAFIEMMDRS